MDTVIAVAVWSVGSFLLGFAIGALVVRNNYKHFKSEEKALKEMIVAGKQTPEQILMRMRNLWKV